MGKERRKGKGTRGALSFRFLLGHHFQPKWLGVQRCHTSEKECGGRFLGHLFSGNAGAVFLPWEQALSQGERVTSQAVTWAVVTR